MTLLLHMVTLLVTQLRHNLLKCLITHLLCLLPRERRGFPSLYEGQDVLGKHINRFAVAGQTRDVKPRDNTLDEPHAFTELISIYRAKFVQHLIERCLGVYIWKTSGHNPSS